MAIHNRSRVNEKNRVPKPSNVKDLPRFVKQLFTVMFFRIGYMVKLVWETKKSCLFIMILFALFNGIMPVVSSLIGANILNQLGKAMTNREMAFTAILFSIVLQCVYTFVNSAFTTVYNTVISIYGELVSNSIKNKMLAKAKEIDIANYDSVDFYASMENANREASSRPVQVMTSVFSFFSTMLSIITYIFVIISVNRIIALTIVVISIPTAIVNFIYRKKNVGYLNRNSKSRRQMNYYADVVVNKDLAKEIRMYQLSDHFADLYQSTFNEYFKGLKKLKIEEGFWKIATTILHNIVYCFVYILFAKGVYDGRYVVGNFVLYTDAITSITKGIETLITTTSSIYENTLFINNLIQFLEAEPTIKPLYEQARPIQRHQPHEIEFRDVYFAYPGSDTYVLKGMSFHIKANETIAIVGLNGAGKTTLIKLLMRLYDPTKGTIYLDGHDIREYDVNALYSLFGTIFQDFGKYAVSCKDNIRFGDLRTKEAMEDIKEAAIQSGANSYIEALKHGYDTQLMRYFDYDGIELSIGQWQKMAVARAFYSDSDILILDEPTASLDAIAEQEIFARFNTLRKNKTTIFISHRLSSATLADRIFVIRDGELVEVGSHEELMKQQKDYATLFNVQASKYIHNMEKREVV